MNDGIHDVILPSPSTFGLLYRLTDKKQYLKLGLELANALLNEVIPIFLDGRIHGCSSKGIHSYVIGHGRNWGAGYVSTILRAALNPNTYGIGLPKINLK